MKPIAAWRCMKPNTRSPLRSASVDLDAAHNYVEIPLSTLTLPGVEATIASLLAGRAADVLYGHGDTGAGSDLLMASRIAVSALTQIRLERFAARLR